MEEKSQIKYEYTDGYAMAGASDRHATITLNMTFMIRNHLRGFGCRVYANNRK